MAGKMDLERFVDAQRNVYGRALAELKDGRKASHWMWFVFPQIKGLGFSAMSQLYAIQSADEARAYLVHPLLGARLRECTSAVNAHQGMTAEAIFGAIDAMKLKSSMTLFDHVAGQGEPFAYCLDCFFSGERDDKTLAILRQADLY